MVAEEERRRRPQEQQEQQEQQQEQQQQQEQRRRRRPAARMTATTLLLALAGAAAVAQAQAFVVPSTGPSGLVLQRQQRPGVGVVPLASSIRGRRGLATLFMASKLKEGGKQQQQQASGFDPLGAAAGNKALAAVGKEKRREAAAAVDREGGEEEVEKGNLLIYKGMLLVVAILWGSNFGALKYLDTCGVEVSLLTSMRFLLASLALLPFLVGKGWGVLKAGLEVGLWVTLGYITQAIGLETTDASKSAFICSLTVVVVPLINGALFGKKIPPATWAACALAIAGVGLLTLQGASGPVIGDLWSLGQPLGFGIAFMRIEHYMQKFQGLAVPLAAAQMLSVFFVSTLWAAVSTHGFQDVGDLSVLADPAHAASLLYTGLVTSAFAVVLESIALAFVPAEETAIIFSTEPLFAAATAAAFLGERLKPTGMLGGVAILAACLVTQVDASALAPFLPLAAKVSDEATQRVE